MYVSVVISDYTLTFTRKSKGVKLVEYCSRTVSKLLFFLE